MSAIAAQIIAETPAIPKAIAKANTGSRTLNAIREGVRALCAEFDACYWRKIDEEKGFPEAFVKAMWAPHGVIMVSYQNQDVLYPDLVSGRIDASLTDAAVADIGFLQTPRNTGFAFAGDAVKPAKEAFEKAAELIKKVNTYLDAESIAIATRLGNGNVSEGIRKALKHFAE